MKILAEILDCIGSVMFVGSWYMGAECKWWAFGGAFLVIANVFQYWHERKMRRIA